MHQLQLKLVHRDNSFFKEVEEQFTLDISSKTTLKCRKSDLQKHQTTN